MLHMNYNRAPSLTLILIYQSVRAYLVQKRFSIVSGENLSWGIKQKTEIVKTFPRRYLPRGSELVVSETSESTNVVSYLDLLIDMSNGDLVRSIFDKRVAFDFDIVKFPDLFGGHPNSSSL